MPVEWTDEDEGRRHIHATFTIHPSHHVKKYPFNPKKKDWHFFSQKEEDVLRLLIPGWTEHDPMFATLKDIFIEEYGYSYRDYVNLTIAEIVEVVKRRRSEGIQSEISRIKSDVIGKFGAEGIRGIDEPAAKEARRKPPAKGKAKRKLPQAYHREALEKYAAMELAKNPDITAEALGQLLHCNKSTIVRLKAWQKKEVLDYSAPPKGFIRSGEDGNQHIEAEDPTRLEHI